MKVVVCGAGAIGCSSAYFLAKRGAEVIVVEQCEVAAAASGKAGGFLALDWNDKGPVGKLARASFALHRELADQFGHDKVGYRPLNTLQVHASEKSQSNKKANVPSWVDGNVSAAKIMGNTETTAQVHPSLYCKAMLQTCLDNGGSLVIGTVSAVKYTDDTDTQIKCVVLQNGDTIACDAMVVAMGPWSGACREWFPKSNIPNIYGQKYNSILYDTNAVDITPHALFLDFEHKTGDNDDPEIYPRPDATVYVCGVGNQNAELPDSAADVKADAENCETLHRIASSVCTKLRDCSIVKQQACFLPYAGKGLPYITRVPNVVNAYLATGHTCWGILNAPATGLGISELIMDGKSKSVDLTSFILTR